MDFSYIGHRGAIRGLATVVVLACLALVLAVGCQNSETTQPPANPDPAGSLIHTGECKDEASAPAAGEGSTNRNCIEYEYDGNGALQLTHLNSAFNCCPDEILAQIKVEGNVIRIEETENPYGGWCDCTCLRDLGYEITDLKPGTYRIEVTQLYLGPEEARLHFEVNLSSSTSGSYCVERSRYPWME